MESSLSSQASKVFIFAMSFVLHGSKGSGGEVGGCWGWGIPVLADWPLRGIETSIGATRLFAVFGLGLCLTAFLSTFPFCDPRFLPLILGDLDLEVPLESPLLKPGLINPIPKSSEWVELESSAINNRWSLGGLFGSDGFDLADLARFKREPRPRRGPSVKKE